jgi:PPK2 family polyphosphate:nucleotide phosphotransferase
MAGRESERWLVKPGDHVRLADVDPDATPGAPGGKGETNKATEPLVKKLFGLQERLWAERKQSLLVVLQAMDAGGKDGIIKHVFTGVNPAGTRVTSFKVPTEEERGHDFLWRIHRAAPGAGEIGIFNRSHYEDVLVVRVHELVAEAVWRARYDQIKTFEDNLAAGGTTIVKLYLHISRDEQKQRLEARLADPTKQWKFNVADLADREKWPEFMQAYEDALNHTSTKVAPWYLIPADHKWYRDFAVSHILVDTLERMNPQFGRPDEDLSKVVIK